MDPTISRTHKRNPLGQLPKKMKSKANNKVILEKLKKDMVLFGKIVMPQMFSVPSPKFHYEIALELLDKTKKQINIIAPRGHAKSRRCISIIPFNV